MGGEQSKYENRGGDGRVTEVANFDFRDFKKEEDGIRTSGDGIMGREKIDSFCDRWEVRRLQRERKGSWCENRRVGGEGCGGNLERMGYFASFHNRIEFINGRS